MWVLQCQKSLQTVVKNLVNQFDLENCFLIIDQETNLFCEFVPSLEIMYHARQIPH